MQQRCLGDRAVGAIGLGALPLSVEGRPDRSQALATVRAALDTGVTLIDTADCYGIGPAETGHNERLVSDAVADWGVNPAEVLLATKGGQSRAPDGSYRRNGHPDHLSSACEASLRALRRDTIDLYQLHAVDPEVPFMESVGALRELQIAGKVRMVGLSNVTVQQIEQARDVVDVVSVQQRLSPVCGDSRLELEYCTRVGIAFLPWAPLGGLAKRGRSPACHAAVVQVAQQRGWSAQRVCLAWLLALSDQMLPIPGASRPHTARDSAAASDQPLTPEEVRLLEGAKR